ncbi:MAG: protein-glutamate O-methyltransferase CheR, partial [Nitrospinae bacterium]|nr:protein-glutamate O-methyltransferase CheR [Nitrospinota bacterium]
QEFRAFQNLVYDKAGIFLSDIKKNLLNNRLQGRLRDLRLYSFNEYYKHVLKDSEELKKFLDAVTTHETSFFRDPRVFDAFALKILPEIAGKKKSGQKIRIWSAACSTGEEPYSIAIAVLETATERDAIIYATDISIGSLNDAKEGRYGADKLVNLKDALIKNYFLKDGDVYKVSHKVKGLVKFIHYNLKEQFQEDNIDIIFCRNVLIYFDKENKRSVIKELHRCLTDGGYLFLGGAESLQDFQTGFKYIAPSIYKKE